MKHSMEEMTRAGCTTPRGIRHWETIGLLGTVYRSNGGTRRYTDEQLAKAHIIAAAQFGGWNLDDIAGMLNEWGKEAHEAILQRLFDQSRAAIRLAELLPVPPADEPPVMEFDL